MDLSGKVAVVTGGGRGIGRACARKLAEQGAEVAIIYRKKPESAAAARAEIEALGRRCATYMCDVSDAALVAQTFAAIVESFGRIDILVNAAGLASWGNFIADTSLEELDKVLKADIYGPFHCIKQVLPVMRAQRSGHIVNISSSITAAYPPTGGPYAVAKAGLEALTRVVAAEETGKGIHANCLAPGLVDTDMGRKLMHVEDLKPLYAQMPFGRVCQPEDVANAMLFLVSEEGSYIQGQVIYITGGKTLSL